MEDDRAPQKRLSFGSNHNDYQDSNTKGIPNKHLCEEEQGNNMEILDAIW